MQGQYLVAVVGQENKIAIRRVKTGNRVGSDWIIDEGLKPDDRVVDEGVQKVKEGMTVNPKPFGEEAQPKTEAPGKPESRQEPTAQPGKKR